MNINVELITAVGAFILSLGGNIFQFFREKKKADTDFVVQLIEKSIVLNKQELETVRSLNKDLEEKIKALELENKEQNKEIDLSLDEIRNRNKEIRELKEEIENLKVSLSKCEVSLKRLENIKENSNG